MSDLAHPVLALIVAAVVTSLIVWGRYLLVSGFFAFCTKVWRPGLYSAQRAQIRREMAWSALSAAIYGIPAGLVLFAWAQLGWTRIYLDLDAWPLWWLPVSVFVYLFAHDSWFYWTHRAMHLPRLYRAMHYVHHQSHPPTAWAAMSFHPWEALSGAILIPALVFILPIHIGALAIVMTVATLFGVTNHLGWEIFPRRIVTSRLGELVITASHHEQHHRKNRCNYGLYFRFWDRLCGTDRGLCEFGPGRRPARGR